MKQDLMKGVIDMHVHTNPDLRLRAYDDFELMEAAIRVGARAIVIKTHQGTTMDRAYLCNRHNEIVHGKTNNFTMFGSITLNKVVGGINPKAVDVALRLGAKVVWLPTQSAKNHMQKNVEFVQSLSRRALFHTRFAARALRFVYIARLSADFYGEVSHEPFHRFDFRIRKYFDFIALRAVHHFRR